MPFDVIKTRQQSRQQHTGFIAEGLALYRAHGMSVFFRGLNFALYRTIPMQAIVYMSYELALKKD